MQSSIPPYKKSKERDSIFRSSQKEVSAFRGPPNEGNYKPHAERMAQLSMDGWEVRQQVDWGRKPGQGVPLNQGTLQCPWS